MSDAETPAWVERYYLRARERLLARLRVLGARDLTQDLLQAAFLNLIVRAAEGLTFENDRLADGYVFQICKNLYISSMRGPRGRTESLPIEQIEPHLELASGAEDVYLDVLRMFEDRVLVDDLLETLKVEDQYHLELWASQDFSNTEIAALIGKTGTAERTQRHRLLRRLREKSDRMKEADK